MDPLTVGQINHKTKWPVMYAGIKSAFISCSEFALLQFIGSGIKHLSR